MTIWKYPFHIDDVVLIEAPAGSCPLSVGVDPQGQLCLWMLVDPSRKKVGYRLFVVGTGNPMHPDIQASWFAGTVRHGPFMWHIFVGGG